MSATDAPDAPIRVLAGDCSVVYDGDRREEHRGRVTVVVKPDNTVLVHDADGYQPVAWLTRADAVACSRAEGFTVDAHDGDQRLRVVAHAEDGFARYPASEAGTPVGDCPDCDATLVRTGGAVTCLDCGERYGLPSGATVTDERCDCGRPRLRVERGHPFDVCLDRECESLDAAVRAAFDGVWNCPDCGDDLRILRRGGLLAGCDSYPDCEASFSLPAGTVVGECDCGLPLFDVGTRRRCLDGTCEG